MRRALSIPVGNGEALIEPPISEWEGLARRTAAAASTWNVPVAGAPLSALRTEARAEALRLAKNACERLGIAHEEAPGPSGLVVMTGHQPELFHPGVWAKHFAVQRFARENGAAALDVVVDSDRCGTVALRVPCVRGRVRKHQVVLTDGGDACYGCVPSPTPEQVARFAEEAVACASALADGAPGEGVRRFVDHLAHAVLRSRTVAEAVVTARRLYEAPAATTYGEVFITEQASTPSFTRFAGRLVCDAERFATIFNEEVRAYRARWRLRSAAHPFPELSVEGGTIETPVWALVGGTRRRVAFERANGRIHLEGAGAIEAGSDEASVARALGESGLRVVPRAVALTMFERLCVADLFVHGVGGSRYEAITDRVIERWLGITPPPFAVVSLTMRLPVTSATQIDRRISELRQALHVAKHNPDRLLAYAAIDDPRERTIVEALVARKRELVARTAEPGADKRAVGETIREVNARLREALAPLVSAIEREIERLEAERDEEEALSDRECSFPLFDPLEVADAVR